MPTFDRSSALVFTVVLVVLVSACASGGEKDRPGITHDHEILKCEHFHVDTETITVPTNNQWGFPIGGGHRIDFTNGAVPSGSRYTISAGPEAPQNGGDQGEIQIVAEGGAPEVFQGEVFLTLNTAGCAGPLGTDLVVVMRDGGTEKSIGGWSPAPPVFIRTLIPHLTTFALAR